MKKFLTMFLAAIFLSGMLMVGNAQALVLGFDGDGEGNYIEMDKWILGGYPEEDPVTGEENHLFTYQDKDTGDFTQDFTFSIQQGKLDGAGVASYNKYDSVTGDPINQYLLADIYLEGNGPLEGEGEVSYSSGRVDFRNTNKNENFGSSTLTEAPTAEIDAGSVIGDAGASFKMDLVFTYNDDLKTEYFGPKAQDLAGKKWMLSLVGGRLNQKGLYDGADYGDDYEDEWIVEWFVSGDTMDSEFTATPEPTTLLLFGTGLLGLAAFGRKKFMKKS